jgi:hypothetical protein
MEVEAEKDRPAVQEPPDVDMDDKHIQAAKQASAPSTGSAPLNDLKKASDDLKSRIDEAKRRHDMPLDSNLGQPDWEEKAADGHLDLPEKDDD